MEIIVSKRMGNQNPTTRSYCEFKKSLYEEALELYRKTNHTEHEWQGKLLEPIMAIEEDGIWAHQKFGYSLPRRNGKTEVVYMVEIWGLNKGLNILHTAHRISTSHASFEKVKSYLEDMGLEDKVHFTSIKAKGQEKIVLLETGGVIQFRTRTITGGLGEGFDMLIIDEAQEYTTDQESALKYTVTDSDNPITIMTGTPPTPLSSGTVFTKYRDATLQGETKYSGWAEWSVDEMKDIHDIDAWYETNPSMGYHLNERKIEAELGEDELDHNVQRLGYWPKYNQKSAISENEWSDLKVEAMPKLAGQLFVGVKYGSDGTNVSLSIAVKTKEEKTFIETLDCRSIRYGNGWILDFLSKADVAKVAIDGASGQNILAGEMKERKLKEPILPTVREVITANSLWEQGIYGKTICHNNQPSLTHVVTNCDKRTIGSNGGFGYRSQYDDMDIGLMDSALLAHWACSEYKPKKKQKISY